MSVESAGKITKSEVEKLAKLSNLEASSTEIEGYQADLSEIIEHISEIRSLYLSGTEREAYKKTPLREDKPGISLEVATALENAPSNFEVPSP